MSILDALLLDPYRISVWIAYRTDGVAGSGTQNDPYDGSTNFAAPITTSTLTNSGLEATATTSVAHGYSNNDVVTIDVQTNPAGWSGTFLIYSVTSTTFKYLMNNLPGGTPAGTMTASKVLGYRFDGVMSAIATTSKEHGFAVNDFVQIAGVTGPDAALYNGKHQITAVAIAKTFQYSPSPAPTNDPQGSSGDATADDKTYRQRLLASLTYALENGLYVATAQISTAYAAHGLAVGDAVKISKATGQLDQAHNDLFNGYQTITAVPNATTFKYSLADNPNPPNQSGSSPSGYYGRLWQAGRVVIEDNIIELVPTPTNYGPPSAILLGYGNSVSPPLFREALIRRNLIRHVDGTSDPPPPTAQGAGIQVSGCGKLIVEENVLDLDRATPIEYSFCDKVRFFNNQTSSGALIQAVDTSSSTKASELTTDIEDTALLAL